MMPMGDRSRKIRTFFVWLGVINLETAVAGLKMVHLTKITLSFEFSVLTLTDFGELSRVVPGLRLRKIQNTSCF
jgi:hypothetical protein